MIAETLSDKSHPAHEPGMDRVTPLLIVGASRSGTTMLNRILGGHDSVFALNELHYFGGLVPSPSTILHLKGERLIQTSAQLISRARQGIWQRKVVGSERDEVRNVLSEIYSEGINSVKLYERLLDYLGSAEKVRYVSDHTPRNILYAGELLKQMPECKIVHIVRDPRAVLYSQKQRWRKRWLGDSQTPLLEALRVWINYHPIIMAKLWNMAIAEGVKLRNNPRFYLLKYEELVADPERQVKKLCKFLGLEFSLDLLAIEARGSSHKESRDKTVGVSSKSLHLWQDGLAEHEIIACEFYTADLMRQMGYHLCMDGSKRVPLRSYLFYLLHAAGAVIFNPKRVIAHLLVK